MMFNMIYIRYIKKQKVLSLFGFSCLKVITGSMMPEIEVGESIIIKRCKEYKVGDIITFIQDDEIITHRISSISDGNYYTRGDANNCDDLEPIKYNQIYGKVIYHFNSFFLNHINSIAKFLNSKNYYVYANIATPIFTLEGNNEIKIENSEINTYSFCIKNYNDTKVSDVDLEYHIQIVADEEIEYHLFFNNAEINSNVIFTLDRASIIKNDYALDVIIPENYEGILKIYTYAHQKNNTIENNFNNSFAKYVFTNVLEVYINNKIT